MPVLSLPGGAVAYDVTGTGTPAILFIHGYSCTAQDWRLQVAGLSSSHTCITMDLRGHGRSGPAKGELTMAAFAADAIALLDALHIERAFLVGHSMGTRIALEAALQAPARVSGLVLVDGSKVEAEPEAVRGAISAAIDALGFAGWSEKNMGEMFLDNLTSEDQNTILQRAIALGPEVGLQLYVNMTAWDQSRLATAIKQVEAPTAVVQSTSILPGEARQRCYVDEAPNSPWFDAWRGAGRANIVALSQTGHFAMLEKPGKVNDVICDVIKQI
ncbi:MAG: alpha/beta hydrolase [Alphaproteobacteria bacterium]|nr:alpha/beta hydrolase [Alphaproteobacteria bacterium]